MVGEAGCVPGPCLRLRIRRGNRSTRSAAGQRQSRLKAAPALPQTVRSEPLSSQSKRGRRLVPSRSRNGDTPVGRTLYRRSSLESRGFCQRQATPRGLGVPRAADPARRTVRAPDSGGPRPHAGGETGRLPWAAVMPPGPRARLARRQGIHRGARRGARHSAVLPRPVQREGVQTLGARSGTRPTPAGHSSSSSSLSSSLYANVPSSSSPKPASSSSSSSSPSL